MENAEIHESPGSGGALFPSLAPWDSHGPRAARAPPSRSYNQLELLGGTGAGSGISAPKLSCWRRRIAGTAWGQGKGRPPCHLLSPEGELGGGDPAPALETPPETGGAEEGGSKKDI